MLAGAIGRWLCGSTRTSRMVLPYMGQIRPSELQPEHTRFDPPQLAVICNAQSAGLLDVYALQATPATNTA